MHRNTGILFAVAAFMASAVSPAADREWQILEDVKDRKVEARILEIGTDKVSFIRKVDGKRYEVGLDQFSEETLALFEKWKEDEMMRAELAGDVREQYLVELY